MILCRSDLFEVLVTDTVRKISSCICNQAYGINNLNINDQGGVKTKDVMTDGKQKNLLLTPDDIQAGTIFG